VAEVVFDGLSAYVELAGDLRVGQASGYENGNIALTIGQVEGRAACGLITAVKAGDGEIHVHPYRERLGTDGREHFAGAA
jgi:hypothetical protein